jgi:hypothetical protein
MTDTDLYLPIRAVLLAFVTDLIMLTGSAGTANKAWNGLAFGAAAGPLHPAVDRPLSRPPGQIPRRPPVA